MAYQEFKHPSIARIELDLSVPTYSDLAEGTFVYSLAPIDAWETDSQLRFIVGIRDTPLSLRVTAGLKVEVFQMTAFWFKQLMDPQGIHQSLHDSQATVLGIFDPYSGNCAVVNYVQRTFARASILRVNSGENSEHITNESVKAPFMDGMMAFDIDLTCPPNLTALSNIGKPRDLSFLQAMTGYWRNE